MTAKLAFSVRGQNGGRAKNQTRCTEGKTCRHVRFDLILIHVYCE